jgi:hypothetical protein
MDQVDFHTFSSICTSKNANWLEFVDVFLSLTDVHDEKLHSPLLGD